MTGISENGGVTEHIIQSEDGKARVWAGTIDDLWKLGKPTGKGGPWKNAKVIAGEPSDPYLMGYYSERNLVLTNHSSRKVNFIIQVDPIGHGPWMNYKKVVLKGGASFEYVFPDAFQARWIRFVADRNCIATAWLEYK